ncbi:alpha/beta hydrolase [Schumannella soli]|uniref:Alpha/beta hydrolase n=1 Tax=Schumannella soli TaxID=2590779 RepID=A0A506Y094_9MICO|nr:alpha/beta hydrolase [Schumannella soli]
MRIGDDDLYEEVAGSGDPLLLLHGGFCSLEHLRAQGDALVAGGRRVLAYERPGHGRTADVAGDYSYDVALASLIAYLDAHALEEVDVVGFSDGAILGLLLAREQPRRVRSLVAISGNLDYSGFSFAVDAPDAPAGARVLRERAAPAASATAETETDGSSAASAAPQRDAERRHYDRLSPDGPAHGDVVMAKLVKLWTEQPRIHPASLAAITARTLILSADRDSVRVDHSLLIAASIPGAQLAIVPGSTHDVVADRPALVETLIREFLAGG